MPTNTSDEDLLESLLQGGLIGAGLIALLSNQEKAEENISIGAIVGAVVGGLAGAAVEKSAVVKDGHEYVVQTSNGALLTLVQGGEPFVEGTKVIVLYGSPARIIADNSNRQ